MNGFTGCFIVCTEKENQESCGFYISKENFNIVFNKNTIILTPKLCRILKDLYESCANKCLFKVNNKNLIKVNEIFPN